MILTESIKEFISSMNKNAPLASSGKRLGNVDISHYKYPYKPLLILAICSTIKDCNELFNNKIFINADSTITKTYYDYLMNSEIMYSFLKTHNHKEYWHLVYNNKVKNQVLTNLYEQPIKKLNANDFWSYDRNQRWVMLNFQGTNQEKIELRKLLIDEAYKALIKCIPDFNMLSEKEFENYDQFYYQMLDHDDLGLNKEVKNRRYQHIFRKIIFQRDNRCKICCLETPELLEAAHIKPFVVCENDYERYNSDNGILLCRNHHKLFDEGYFTFTNDWKVKISDEYIKNHEVDLDLLFKTFERCYEKELKAYPNSNSYTDYHSKNIYRH